jgi:hypothetical protein
LWFSSAAFADNQDDQCGAGPKVYQVYACLNPNCIMEANTSTWPNDVDYKTYATLTLPAGYYLLQGKLSGYSITWLPEYMTGGGTMECYLGVDPYSKFTLPSGQEWYMYTDWASVQYNNSDQKGVSMAVAVRLTARSTTVGIGCRLMGNYVDSEGMYHPFQVGVWGARLIAERMGSVVTQ